MSTIVLIVGGAGFIGSHLVDELLVHGYRVRALDNLDPQVHDSSHSRPRYLSSDAELIVGDIRDPEIVSRALRGVDKVVHLAAAVGVGQSMYEIARYTSINALGTAVLLESAVKQQIERLVVASSMSIYGEGLYRDRNGRSIAPPQRDFSRLRQQNWDIIDDTGEPLTPIATPEGKQPQPSSIYALLKYNQEQACLCAGKAYQIPTVALRFFNTYGPRQALSNPYTGVMAIFSSRMLNGERPIIYEDGLQRRDFVSVHDVARACRIAMESPAATGQAFNIGSGCEYTIKELAESIARALGKKHPQLELTGKYRVGDIRHCFADIRRAQDTFGYQPSVDLEDGLAELAEWLQGQAAVDRIPQASAELAARGLAL
jgi:dTDP-L-rhamnose 4-epimerase